MSRNGCARFNKKDLNKDKVIDSWIVSFPIQSLSNTAFKINNLLSFKFYADILCIKYDDDDRKDDDFQECKLNSNTKFEWNIDYQTYEKFKNWNHGKTQFFSNNFGFNDDPSHSFTFCLGLIPETSKLGLKFVALPKNIGKIICRVVLGHQSNTETSNHATFCDVSWDMISYLFIKGEIQINHI